MPAGQAHEEKAVPLLAGDGVRDRGEGPVGTALIFESGLGDGDPELLALVMAENHATGGRKSRVPHLARTMARRWRWSGLFEGVPSTGRKETEIIFEDQLGDTQFLPIREAAVSKLLDPPGQPAPEILSVEGTRFLAAVELPPLLPELPHRHLLEGQDLGGHGGLLRSIHGPSLRSNSCLAGP